jgi:hypothetical protein
MTNGWSARIRGFTNMNSRAEHHRWRRSVHFVVYPTIIADRPVKVPGQATLFERLQSEFVQTSVGGGIRG